MSLLNKASLIMTPNAVKQSKVYSIIPSNGNGDFTFTRGTPASATQTDGSGIIEVVPYNLVLRSEEFDSVNWLKFSVTVTPDQIVSPNGTLTADLVTVTSDSGNRLNQQIVVLPNTTYNFSFYVKSGSLTTSRYSIFDGTNASNIVAPTNYTITNQWTRISFSFTTPATCVLINAYTTRGQLENGTYYVWGAQLVQGSIPRDYFYTTDRFNVPRLNYDTVGGCPSLLLEPQRTNLLLNSVWAGGGSLPTSWSATFATGTSTPIASIKNPNVTAYRFVTTTQRQVFQQTFAFVLNSITTISVYIEQVTTAINVNQLLLIDGTGTGTPVYLKNNVVITSSTPIEAGNTYSLQFTCTLGGSFSCKVGSGTSSNITGNFVLSMPQLEQGAYPTTYIPTTSGTVTRVADTMSRNNIFTNGLITSAGGTWFIELNNNFSLIRDIGARGISISDNSTDFIGNAFYIRSGGATSQRLTITKYIGGVSSVFYLTTTDTVKIAIKWNGATADIFVNGVKVVSATAFTTTNMEFLNVGGQDVPKYIKSMLLFPTPLTDTEMTNLTTL
jgi:hypothetical protein